MIRKILILATMVACCLSTATNQEEAEYELGCMFPSGYPNTVYDVNLSCEGTFTLKGNLLNRNNRFFQNTKAKVSNSEEYKTFKIRKNRRSNNFHVKKISVSGTCCWTVRDRYGNEDMFSPGHFDRTPAVAFIKYVYARPC